MFIIIVPACSFTSSIHTYVHIYIYLFMFSTKARKRGKKEKELKESKFIERIVFYLDHSNNCYLELHLFVTCAYTTRCSTTYPASTIYIFS